MTTTLERYRLRISDPTMTVPGNPPYRTYIVRDAKGKVTYTNGTEDPIALSNLVGHVASELRFELEDAKDGSAAKKAVDAVLVVKWKNRPECLPKVEVL